MCDLDCDHCGGIAFTSTKYDAAAAEGQGAYLFTDGDGEACASCGFPGSVVVDDQQNGEDVHVTWSCRDGNDDVCKDPLCEECEEYREASPIRASAVSAVRAIVADLTDRRGLKQEWHRIENEIRWQIVETWIGHVESCTTHQVSEGGGK